MKKLLIAPIILLALSANASNNSHDIQTPVSTYTSTESLRLVTNDRVSSFASTSGGIPASSFSFAMQNTKLDGIVTVNVVPTTNSLQASIASNTNYLTEGYAGNTSTGTGTGKATAYSNELALTGTQLSGTLPNIGTIDMSSQTNTNGMTNIISGKNKSGWTLGAAMTQYTAQGILSYVPTTNTLSGSIVSAMKTSTQGTSGIITGTNIPSSTFQQSFITANNEINAIHEVSVTPPCFQGHETNGRKSNHCE